VRTQQEVTQMYDVSMYTFMVIYLLIFAFMRNYKIWDHLQTLICV